MKILATRGAHSDLTYIAEIEHDEIEKFLNLYYGGLPKAREGDEIDLSKGYDFHKETLKALQTTEKFIQDNKMVIHGLLSGFSLIGRITDGALDETPNGQASEPVGDKS